MGIKANFNISSVKAYVEKWKQGLIEDLKLAFSMACSEVVENAKSIDTYKDQTGNLRSSIGYVIYYKGEEIESSFSPVATEIGDGKYGTSQGLSFARDKVKELAGNGFVAVVVAGMDYAAYVEAKGFDVLTGSALRFADIVKKHLATVNEVYGTKF